MDKLCLGKWVVPSVYLIHFDQPVGGRAWHYMGYASDLAARIKRHRQGNGAALMAEVGRLGIGWRVVRVWAGDRCLERKLKRRKNHARLCPVCNPGSWQSNAAMEDQSW